MLRLEVNKGSTPCTKECPFFEERGEVQCFGGPKKTACRMVMHEWWVDCQKYDVRTAVVNGKRIRKLYKTNRKKAERYE